MKKYYRFMARMKALSEFLAFSLFPELGVK